jgi:hypothetical protein
MTFGFVLQTLWKTVFPKKELKPIQKDLVSKEVFSYSVRFHSVKSRSSNKFFIR